MGSYGIVVPAFTGHLNPITVLGRALEQRGHRVVLISPLDAEAKVRRAGLEFVPIAIDEFPAGAWEESAAQMGELSGWKASLFCGRWLGRLARGILRDLPEITARQKFDGIVMDQVAIGTECVCAAVGLPVAVACAALMLHFESGVPPATVFLRYRPGLPFRVRNLASQLAANYTGWPVARELIRFQRRHRLPRMAFNHMNEMPPSLVHVSQQPACFDFPRRRLPDHVHYTGPWKEKERKEDTDLPWHRLNDRPLIYASLGTLQNRLEHVFRIVAEACAGLGLQVLISLGRRGAEAPAGCPGEPIIVDYAPQLEVLKRASLVITHGGLNTALETLSQGLPLIALPIANDQPGVAARIEHLGLGLAIPLKKLTAPALRQAVLALLESPVFRENARNCADEIRRAGNHGKAAELIEHAITRRCRVKRPLVA
jgi:zeaxanthin glucosyltransferase